MKIKLNRKMTGVIVIVACICVAMFVILPGQQVAVTQDFESFPLGAVNDPRIQKYDSGTITIEQNGTGGSKALNSVGGTDGFYVLPNSSAFVSVDIKIMAYTGYFGIWGSAIGHDNGGLEMGVIFGGGHPSVHTSDGYASLTTNGTWIGRWIHVTLTMISPGRFTVRLDSTLYDNSGMGFESNDPVSSVDRVYWNHYDTRKIATNRVIIDNIDS